MNNSSNKKKVLFPTFRLGTSAVCRFYARLAWQSCRHMLEHMTEKKHNQTFSMKRFPLASSMTIAFVVVCGVAGYAYASPNVTRGDTLYGVKQGMESLRVAAARTPYQKVRVHTDLSLRRLAEARVLAQKLGDSSPEFARLFGIQVAYAQEDTSASSTIDNAVDTASSTVTATSTEEQSSNSTGTQQDLEETLNDMNDEMDVAASSTQEISLSEELSAALDLIKNAQNQQMVGLAELATLVTNEEDDSAIFAVAIAFDDIQQRQKVIASLQKNVAKAITAVETNTTINTVTSTDSNEDVDNTEADDDTTTTQEQVQEDTPLIVTETKQQLESFKEKLAQSGINEKDADKLVSRLEKKVSQIEEAVAEGNEHQAAGLSKAFNALQRNAKHFVTINHEDEDELDDDIEDIVMGDEHGGTQSTSTINSIQMSAIHGEDGDDREEDDDHRIEDTHEKVEKHSENNNELDIDDDAQGDIETSEKKHVKIDVHEKSKVSEQRDANKKEKEEDHEDERD